MFSDKKIRFKFCSRIQNDPVYQAAMRSSSDWQTQFLIIHLRGLGPSRVHVGVADLYVCFHYRTWPFYLSGLRPGRTCPIQIVDSNPWVVQGKDELSSRIIYHHDQSIYRTNFRRFLIWISVFFFWSEPGLSAPCVRLPPVNAGISRGWYDQLYSLH